MALLTSNQTQNNQPNTPAPVNANPNAASTGVCWPFDKSGKMHSEQGPSQTLAAAAWSTSTTQNFQVPTFGFLSELIITLTASGGAN